MNELADTPSNGAEPLTQEYVERTISSAIPESDRKYLGEEAPEKVVPEKTPKKTPETPQKPEIGDSEIPLDDDEPEKVVEEEGGESEEEEEQQRIPEKRETDDAKSDAKWKQYREAYRENPKLKSENQTLKAQLAKAGDDTEVKALREHVQALANERQRLVALVEQGNIEHSDMWNDQVMVPLNQMWDDVQTISKRNGMDANELARLLQNGDDEVLQNYMEEHSTRPGDRHYLFGMIRDIDRIEKHKKYLRDNASQLSQKSRQEFMERRDNAIKGLTSLRSNAIEAIVPKIEQKILSVLPKDKRRNLQNDVKHILDFEKWEPDIQMFAGVSAVVLPDLLDSYNLLRSQLREAKMELVKFRGGGPRIATGGKTPRLPAPSEEDTPDPAKLAKTSLTDFADESTKRIRQVLGYRK